MNYIQVCSIVRCIAYQQINNDSCYVSCFDTQEGENKYGAPDHPINHSSHSSSISYRLAEFNLNRIFIVSHILKMASYYYFGNE